MEKKSKISSIIIVILLILVIGMGVYILLTSLNKDINSKKDEEKIEQSTIVKNDEKLKKGLIKSETYIVDLNKDNIKEELTINYYGKEDAVNKIGMTLKEEEKEFSYIINEDNLETKFDVKSQIVDINMEDNYSELMITGYSTKTNGQYSSTIFIGYNRNELKPIKIGYPENSVKTYNYTLNQNKDIQYLRMGIFVTSETQENNKIYEKPIKLEIKNNSIIVVSNSGKEEVYTLNANHELELASSKLIKNSEFYQSYMSNLQKTIKVYQENKLTSQSYGAQETKEMKVLDVIDNWLKLELPTGAIVYAYSDDIK